MTDRQIIGVKPEHLDKDIDLRVAYLKLLKKCVDYEEKITDLYNENYNLKVALEVRQYEEKK